MDKFIYIVRHGTTETCDKGKIKGQENDVFLTNEGISQINQSLKHLLNTNIKKIYTSNFKRTRQTSELIKNSLDINDPSSIILDDRLSNKDKSNNYQANIETFLKELITNIDINDNCCIVTHGKIIKLIYYYTLNESFPLQTPKVDWCKYGSVSCLKVKNNKLIPIYFGKTFD